SLHCLLFCREAFLIYQLHRQPAPCVFGSFSRTVAFDPFPDVIGPPRIQCSIAAFQYICIILHLLLSVSSKKKPPFRRPFFYISRISPLLLSFASSLIIRQTAVSGSNVIPNILPGQHSFYLFPAE